MAHYETEKNRNFVLLGHHGTGKTSLAEAMLYDTGAISRLGKVADGTSASDYDPIEIKHHLSVNLAILPCEWQGYKLNVIDTPGYLDFVAEVKAGIKVAEGAIITVCAASGIEVGTEQAWEYATEAGLGKIFFVNKMDRENADYFKTVEALQVKFGAGCVPIQIPVGSQADFQGIIDLIDMKCYEGVGGKESGIPSTLLEQAESYRAGLIETAAEMEDSLLEKFLAGEEPTREELVESVRKGIKSGKIIPILTGSSLKNIGLNSLMDAVTFYLPSPNEKRVDIQDESGKVEIGNPAEDMPLGALVFKTTADPFVGKLTYFRVFSGTLASNSHVWNSSKGADERIGQLFMVRGKNHEPVSQVGAGDIGGVAKLNVTATGDTLCSKEKPLILNKISFPEPSFSLAVYPKTKTDLDKLGTALSRLTEEDPTLHVQRKPTGETILSGLGETQLAVAAEKMQQKFGVGVDLQIPKVPYMETITAHVKAEYKHRKQTGGHGQYGHVMLELEPMPGAGKFEFVEKVVGGKIPKNFIPAVEKGVHEAVHEGVLAGYPVTDVRVIVYDGSFHPVDSSEICFKIAGAGALKQGLLDGKPILLEPIVNITVTVPEQFTGDIVSDLNTKRAQLQGMNPSGGINVIQAKAPMADVLRYAIDLKSITQGRGVFTTEFSHYEAMPPAEMQKIIEGAKHSVKEPVH